MPAVRVSEDTHRALKELSEREHEPMPEIVAKAVEAYRRARFLREANEAYAALRETPAEWKLEQEERRAWDATLEDGLEDERE